MAELDKLLNHQSYVVSFEVVNNENCTHVFHGGEMGFKVYNYQDLSEEIESTLELIGQPFIPYIQIGLVAKPVNLFLVKDDGTRESLQLPENLVQKWKERESDEKEMRDWLRRTDSDYIYGPAY